MVITNNDITQKTYKKLSIQVSLSGLSFCVFDLLSNKVINTMSIHFEKNKVICAKNTKESKKVIRRMDKAQKSSKDNYNTK